MSQIHDCLDDNLNCKILNAIFRLNGLNIQALVNIPAKFFQKVEGRLGVKQVLDGIPFRI